MPVRYCNPCASTKKSLFAFDTGAEDRPWARHDSKSSLGRYRGPGVPHRVRENAGEPLYTGGLSHQLAGEFEILRCRSAKKNAMKLVVNIWWIGVKKRRHRLAFDQEGATPVVSALSRTRSPLVGNTRKVSPLSFITQC